MPRKGVKQSMATLYQIQSDYMELLDMAGDPEVDEQTLLDTLEGIKGEFAEKVENYCKVIRQVEADGKALKEEADRLKERANTCTSKAKAMKEAIKKAMVETGNTSIDAGLFKLKVVNNGGTCALKTKDITEIPKEFIKMVPQIDTDAVKGYLKTLPEGVECAWAWYEERGTHLTIK